MVLSLFLMRAKVQISYYMASLGIKKASPKRRETPWVSIKKRKPSYLKSDTRAFLLNP
ncbi:hypothetical protein POREN0001_1804 [Porphyromonas endodontalis ATCC 35406]|uniref:Uncharacterized protein n=1 Tax=Porphyromonas endodontalis (strain ATCC 35406 / DSM 24491 / JCM 8526 / CCUG 16442 / BCRC 14492 / NCTC 13058 / HG 370) TaxID=553175 RepID=C3JBR8_POREA|nr:hypothetical protein POREN0001_1804 [Porphyromonas endodontalis ATCC 35406]